MMQYDPNIHHRRSIRLDGYDYAQPGAYFVTIVAWQREVLFGEVTGGVMRLNAAGEVVMQAWIDLPHHYRHISLDAMICMPNHAHAIIVINDSDDRNEPRRGGSVPGRDPAPSITVSGKISLPDNAKTRPYHSTPHGLPEIVRAFKSYSARRINILRRTPGVAVWQRNYYEHIIRNETEWARTRAYIEGNPATWQDDEEYRPQPAH